MKPLLTPTESNAFDKLPSEILLQVLSFLDLDGLDVLNLVCRRFSDVIEHDSGPNGRLALRAIEKVNVAKEVNEPAANVPAAPLATVMRIQVRQELLPMNKRRKIECVGQEMPVTELSRWLRNAHCRLVVIDYKAVDNRYLPIVSGLNLHNTFVHWLDIRVKVGCAGFLKNTVQNFTNVKEISLSADTLPNPGSFDERFFVDLVKRGVVDFRLDGECATEDGDGLKTSAILAMCFAETTEGRNRHVDACDRSCDAGTELLPLIVKKASELDSFRSHDFHFTLSRLEALEFDFEALATFCRVPRGDFPLAEMVYVIDVFDNGVVVQIRMTNNQGDMNVHVYTNV